MNSEEYQQARKELGFKTESELIKSICKDLHININQ